MVGDSDSRINLLDLVITGGRPITMEVVDVNCQVLLLISLTKISPEGSDACSKLKMVLSRKITQREIGCENFL